MALTRALKRLREAMPLDKVEEAGGAVLARSLLDLPDSPRGRVESGDDQVVAQQAMRVKLRGRDGSRGLKGACGNSPSKGLRSTISPQPS
jgi:hypothetical protein